MLITSQLGIDDSVMDPIRSLASTSKFTHKWLLLGACGEEDYLLRCAGDHTYDYPEILHVSIEFYYNNIFDNISTCHKGVKT